MSAPDPAGRVIWITGLSGSGKTTLAKALLPRLPQPRLLLDGDEMRDALALVASGYDVDSREHLAETYSRLCLLAARQGVTVVCATISMFHSVREWNRLNLPGYFEIYLEAGPEVLRERDYKGVYRDSGQNVVGNTIQPELPESPDITFRQGKLPPEAMVDEILAAIAVTSPPNRVPERPLCRVSP